MDLDVRTDFSFAGLSASSVGAGLRRVELESTTVGELLGIPDWNVPANSFTITGGPATHTLYNIDVSASRTFDGFGPTVTWKAAFPLLDMADAGRVRN